MHRQTTLRVLSMLLALAVGTGVASASTSRKSTVKKPTRKTTAVKRTKTTAVKRQKKSVISKRSTPAALTSRVSRRRARRVRYNPWTVPTYADSTTGDRIDGEDLTVRRAAVESLGPYNGTVVAVDPDTGRVLTMVNQRVALTSGFQPCSTIKVPVALAALSEGLIDRNTPVRLYGRTSMTLTQALAKSNNPYFANLGIKLGYDKFTYYARLFGLGEKAGLNIPGEEAGIYPEAPPKNGGMGMMTSFGEGITFTPLQLAALLSSIANDGTLYYLQYPQSQADLEAFVPRVKRQLDIKQLIAQVRPGMSGAVEFGTARRAVFDPEAPVCGKTGTCTGGTTHLGWFGSFSDFGDRKLVVVVLLTGGHGVSGPTAAQISGNIYRKLIDEGYFRQRPVLSPAILVPR
ncbi:MAG TPA: penicillin-binding transpeptidase domain-containing protein [Bryobacteraceae bacterium]|nr:penicillin-binding transpeptidase domain-containing protein [Bryobacteraceae bacterium]